MTDALTHLSEETRQALAEGAADAERGSEIDAHLARCEACAADVERLRAFMTRMRETPARRASLDELWPTIRARIEQSKIIALDAPAEPRRAAPRRHAPWVVGLVAAALVAAFGIRQARRVTIEPSPTAAAPERGVAITVVDSVRTYEQEARILLNRLELRRSMLRPEAAASIDRDLRVIDAAIDELKLAIANDPTNAALRRLLASSYRQKIDLLTRADNAG